MRELHYALANLKQATKFEISGIKEITVKNGDLQALIYHFERIDSELRSGNKRNTVPRESDLRGKAILSALSSKNYAVDPYGFNAKFVWDWQQDNYIELDSGENVQEVKNLPHCCVCHIEDFITNGDEILLEGYIIEIESVHIYKNHVLSICCKDGVILSHRAWRDIDWEKCGF